jgi:hypothetical protein
LGNSTPGVFEPIDVTCAWAFGAVSSAPNLTLRAIVAIGWSEFSALVGAQRLGVLAATTGGAKLRPARE